MTKIVKLPKSPSFKYDWNLIEDGGKRSAAKSAVEAYEKTHHQNRASVEGYLDAAAQKIEGDNAAKARCVYSLKLTLPHGSFLDVCEAALSIKADNATALATSGKILVEQGVSAVEEKMVAQMAAQAGSKFLRSEPETKNRYVTVFEETGQVPSQRDFVKQKATQPEEVQPVSFDSETSIPIKAEVILSSDEERLKEALGIIDNVFVSKGFKSDTAQKTLGSIQHMCELMLGQKSFR